MIEERLKIIKNNIITYPLSIIIFMFFIMIIGVFCKIVLLGTLKLIFIKHSWIAICAFAAIIFNIVFLEVSFRYGGKKFFLKTIFWDFIFYLVLTYVLTELKGNVHIAAGFVQHTISLFIIYGGLGVNFYFYLSVYAFLKMIISKEKQAKIADNLKNKSLFLFFTNIFLYVIVIYIYFKN